MLGGDALLQVLDLAALEFHHLAGVDIDLDEPVPLSVRLATYGVVAASTARAWTARSDSPPGKVTPLASPETLTGLWRPVVVPSPTPANAPSHSRPARRARSATPS